MRVVFMGTPDFAVTALKRIHDLHTVVAVYTQPPRPAGRGQQPRLSPVQAFATQHGLPVFSPATLKTADVQQQFADLKADIAVVAAYGLILPKVILAAPRLGCLNIHASLLPRWRGAAPIQRAIMAGDHQSGVTIMQMEAGLDTGPMLLAAETPITPETTAGTLHDTLSEIGAGLIVETLQQIETLSPRPQPSHGVTYAVKIEKSESEINFDRPARDVLHQVHGLSPFPGAWFAHNAERVKVLKAVAVDGEGAPGTVLDDTLTIACASGAIRALEVQRAGKGVTDTQSFLRGYALAKGTKLA